MLTGAARTAAPERDLADGALGRMMFDVAATGVVVGRDSAGRPVLLRLFDAEPRTVMFIGGWWAAQVLVFRCLAHGAAVAVDALETTDPSVTGTVGDRDRWLALGLAAGVPGRVGPMAGDPDSWPAGAAQPLLRLHDVGPVGPAARPHPAWHTQLTVLSQLTPAYLQAVASADVVLVQRLAPADAGLLRAALILGPEFVQMLGSMDNEMVAAFGGGAVRYAWLTPTPVERQLFG